VCTLCATSRLCSFFNVFQSMQVCVANNMCMAGHQHVNEVLSVKRVLCVHMCPQPARSLYALSRIADCMPFATATPFME
jgi:hypothetical protein